MIFPIITYRDIYKNAPCFVFNNIEYFWVFRGINQIGIVTVCFITFKHSNIYDFYLEMPCFKNSILTLESVPNEIIIAFAKMSFNKRHLSKEFLKYFETIE